MGHLADRLREREAAARKRMWADAERAHYHEKTMKQAQECKDKSTIVRSARVFAWLPLLVWRDELRLDGFRWLRWVELRVYADGHSEYWRLQPACHAPEDCRLTPPST